MIVTTAIYGGYDDLKPHPDHPLVSEWVCYTDDERLTDNPKGWTVKVRPLPYNHPRLAAKWWKCHPPQYTPSLWIDGSVEIVNAGFIDEVRDSLDEMPLAMWRHPWRDCIYDEANVSAGMPKYHGLPLQQQVEHYRSLGWPAHGGLWATTVIGWRPTGRLEFLGSWFSHCEAFTYQDQLSLPVLLKRYGIKPAELPGRFLDERWVRWHSHRTEL